MDLHDMSEMFDETMITENLFCIMVDDLVAPQIRDKGENGGCSHETTEL